MHRMADLLVRCAQRRPDGQVIVGYTTPSTGSTFPVTFQGNTTGSTFTDVKDRSHGDL